MSTDPIATYQEALRNLDVATRQAERIVGVVTAAGSKLCDWKQVSMSNIDLGFPPEVTLSGHSINAREWPTAQELGEALANWHQAHQAVERAWRMIPSDRRMGLQPPP